MGQDDDFDESGSLLPCPFCGGAAYEYYNQPEGEAMAHYVGCVECDCATGAFNTEQEARQNWNTRVQE